MLRRLLLVLSVASLPALARAADTYTARTVMTKPAIGSSGWGVKISSDLDIIDSSAALQGVTNTFTSSNTFKTDVLASFVSVSSLTATGTGGFSIVASSAIHIIDGGVLWPDGSISTSAFTTGATVRASTAALFTSDFTGSNSADSTCINSTMTFTTRNVPVDIIFNGPMGSSGSGDTPFFTVLVDGDYLSPYSASKPMATSREPGGSSEAYFPLGLYYRTRSALSAGSHSFCIVFNRGTGGGGVATLFCGTAPCSFEIREAN